MTKIIFIVMAICSSFAHGQLSNLPDTAGLTKVGRIPVFASVQPLSWMIPAAFSSQMECTSNLSSDKRTCTVKIFNQLNQQEQAQVEKMMAEKNLGITPFSNVDSQVVQNISEFFELLPQDIGGNTLSLKTLALSNNLFPYGSMMFRVSQDRAQELLNSYENEGLGKFVVKFNLTVQNTEMYLAVKDGLCLKKHLGASADLILSKKEAKDQISSAISSCGLISVAYEGKEAEVYMEHHLRSTFYLYRNGKFILDSQRLKLVGERYVLHNDQGEIDSVRCTSELTLSSKGVVKTVCEYENGEQL